MAPTICLNMIVKDEEHILERTLQNLCDCIKFDYWVICDTGSTDGTRDLITRFFAKQHIKGELHEDEWRDFAHNRSLALMRAYNKTDLLLVFDADDEIHGKIVLPSAVTHDQYALKFGAADSDVTYTRTLLINNRKRFRYYSVVHEYISCMEEASDPNARMCLLDGNYYLVSGRAGARSKDPLKYRKDAEILAAAHKKAVAAKDNLYKRYAFYCANSYFDDTSYELAIQWYKTVLSQDNWEQEKYVSCFRLYECYEKLGKQEMGLIYLVEGMTYDLSRAECPYLLIKHYCCMGTERPACMRVAYYYYRVIAEKYESARGMPIIKGEDTEKARDPALQQPHNEKLFMSSIDQNFNLPYFMIIVAYKLEDIACGVTMFEIIFKHRQRFFSVWHINNLLNNLRFYVPHAVATDPTFADRANAYVAFLAENGFSDEFFRKITATFDYAAHGVHLTSPSNKSDDSTYPALSDATSYNVMFYTGFADAPWNYTHTMSAALGGSEKAVAYLSQELKIRLKETMTRESQRHDGSSNSSRNHGARNVHQTVKVFVVGTVAPEPSSRDDDDSVTYVPLQQLSHLLTTTPMHAIICSRYISILPTHHRHISPDTRIFIWAHDTCLLPYGCEETAPDIIDTWASRITACVCQTPWHRRVFEDTYPALRGKIHVINNGIRCDMIRRRRRDDTDQSETRVSMPLSITPPYTDKVRHRFIFTSRPERGLARLLTLWPQIVQLLPDATLVISSYVPFPAHNEEGRALQSQIQQLNTEFPLLALSPNELGEPCTRIRHAGALAAEALYNEMHMAEFWLYPSHYHETSCITAMEMLMAGVVCMYYPIAGLADTLNGQGIELTEGLEIEGLMTVASPDDVDQQATANRHRLIERGVTEASRWSWSHRATEWMSAFF